MTRKEEFIIWQEIDSRLDRYYESFLRTINFQNMLVEDEVRRINKIKKSHGAHAIFPSRLLSSGNAITDDFVFINYN